MKRQTTTISGCCKLRCTQKISAPGKLFFFASCTIKVNSSPRLVMSVRTFISAICSSYQIKFIITSFRSSPPKPKLGSCIPEEIRNIEIKLKQRRNPFIKENRELFFCVLVTNLNYWYLFQKYKNFSSVPNKYNPSIINCLVYKFEEGKRICFSNNK